MGANTKIEWAHHTFNPVVGCTKVSPACDLCYAEGWAKRTGNPELWNGLRRRTSAALWRQPLNWNAEATAAGKRYRVFCASLADVFDNRWVPEWRSDLWDLIARTPSLDWLLLTKRPQNIGKMLPLAGYGWPWPNVWLGTTAENQEEANRRIPHLLAVPAKVHFLSCEPLLGPIDFDLVAEGFAFTGRQCIRIPKRKPDIHPPINDDTTIGDAVRHLGGTITSVHDKIDWVICGGESGGAKARPMAPVWARSLRDQCAEAGVPFFFKQWGEWVGGKYSTSRHTILAKGPPDTMGMGWTLGPPPHDPKFVHEWPDGQVSARVGKSKAGRLLDGRTHDEFPEAELANQ